MSMIASNDAVVTRGRGSSGLADVVQLILDKGLVIDAFVRVSVVGIELITIDARIVVASVDTYLRFAEAVNRLDLTEEGGVTLPDLQKRGAGEKTKGALEGAKEKLSDVLPGDGSREKEQEKEKSSSR